MKRILFLLLSLISFSSLFGQEVDSIIDIRDGQVYNIVKIGQQWWMQENLDIGIKIDSSQDATDNDIIEYYYYRNNDSLGNIYGGLYQWDEMMDYNPSDNGNPGITQGVCLTGWHIPTDEEWKELEVLLGMSRAEADATDLRGSDEGGRIKEVGTTHWDSPNTGATNVSKFTALPGGYRNHEEFFEGFEGLGVHADFWSSSVHISGNAWFRTLLFNSSEVARFYDARDRGYSIRCLRDSCQFGYLTVSDTIFKSVTDLNFYGGDVQKKLIIINSNARETINVSSIGTKTSAYILNKSLTSLLPGDSIHLKVTFNPPIKGTYYTDTLRIESNDPYHPVISVPLDGYLPEVDSIIDIRDGQIYKVVKIGQQWWMQENLNIGAQINSPMEAANNNIIEKYCYDDLESNCDLYGGLYQWNEMMDYNPSDDGNHGITRGVCPARWHLPTDSEWTELVDFLGGEFIAGGKLKETGTTQWYSPNTGATNESGFSALPAGCHYVSGQPPLGYYTYFWSSTISNGGRAWDHRLSYSSSGVMQSDEATPGVYEDVFSVRCLRDSSGLSFLTVSDTNFNPVGSLDYYGSNVINELIVINSSAGETINVSSIYTNNSAFIPDKSSSILSPGDSIHFTITFNPPVKNIYLDTLFIQSDDPYQPLITIPLNGTFPPEISFTDSANVSCFGYSDGSATVTPSLGTPPYQYHWDDPGNTTDSIVTGLMANIYYRVTVTDSFDWSITDSVILSQPYKLVTNPAYSDTICLGSTSGYISPNPSGGTAPYTYLWSNDSTVQNASNLAPGDYWIKVTDSNGCTDSTNLTIHSAVPFEGEEICIVTIDQLQGQNIVVWEKTPDKGTAYYKIWRESNLMGTVAYNDWSIFKDTVADPETRPYLYYISVVDSCGNESGLSPYHKPFFLQYGGTTDGVNLNWSEYLVEGGSIGFDSYAIYRGSDSTALTPLAENIPTVVGEYKDNTPEALVQGYYYRVAGELITPCYPSNDTKSGTQPYHHALSNLDNNRLTTGIMGTPGTDHFDIFPNPMSTRATIWFYNPAQAIYRLSVLDFSGKVVYERDNIINDKIEFSGGKLSPGLYIIELKGPNVYRGKIVVE